MIDVCLFRALLGLVMIYALFQATSAHGEYLFNLPQKGTALGSTTAREKIITQTNRALSDQAFLNFDFDLY